MTSFTFGLHEDDAEPEGASDFFDRLDQSTREALDNFQELQDGFQARLRQRYGDGFDSLLVAYHFAIEAAEWAAEAVPAALEHDEEEEQFNRYYGVIRGLTARSMLAFSEIIWLRRGGYVAGAYSRIRTLYELAIVASILAEYGNPGAKHPELVERYVRHHEVFTRSEADQLMATGVLDPATFFDAETLQALDRQRDDLLARYGKSFATLWGWAAPLFKPREQISMAKLSQLVEPGVGYFYGMTSEHVHGGSAGWHGNLIDREHETVRAVGPTNAGLSIPVVLATHLTLSVLEVAIPAKIETETKSEEVGALFLAAISRAMRTAREQVSAGESAVQAAERDFQASLRDQQAEGDGVQGDVASESRLEVRD